MKILKKFKKGQWVKTIRSFSLNISKDNMGCPPYFYDEYYTNLDFEAGLVGKIVGTPYKNFRGAFTVKFKLTDKMGLTKDIHQDYLERSEKPKSSQGHSLKIDLNLKPIKPPSILYHGTVQKFIEPIFKKGLIKGKRQHVHLSKEIQTAKKVGKRRGVPVILIIDSEKMYNEGYKFFLSKNGVWLTDNVPSRYMNIAE